MKPNVIIINPKDNVAIALEDIKEGGTIYLPEGGTMTALSDIAYSHKVLLSDLEAGGDIVKYGEAIAKVKQNQKRGDWIHVHNLNLTED